MTTSATTVPVTTVPVTTTPDGRRAALRTTIAGVYDAFGRGDLPAILAVLAEDVAWDSDWLDLSAQHDPVVEHLAPRRGPGGAAEFFGVLAGYTFHEFGVLGLVDGDDDVVARVVAEFSLPNGGRLRDEELHWWQFDEHGRVTSFRHYVDTAKHRRAAAGEDTTR